MPLRRAIRLQDGSTVHTAVTDVDDGDLRIDADPAELAPRRAAVARGEWTWLRQVHGPRVVVVREPGEHRGAEADAAVTAAPDAVLAVHTADCAGVLLWGAGPNGAVLGAAHAGWRGLLAGVLENTVEAMQGLGAHDLHWSLGPCISASAYEFGPADLDRLVERYGSSLAGTTSGGAPALDLRAGVRSALAAQGGIEEGVTDDGDAAVICTAASSRHWSWRARRDSARQAAVIWSEPPGGGSGSADPPRSAADHPFRPAVPGVHPENRTTEPAS